LPDLPIGSLRCAGCGATGAGQYDDQRSAITSDFESERFVFFGT
jgi:hypothetical protein